MFLSIFSIVTFYHIHDLNITKPPPIYCLMVTGYSNKRLAYAKLAVQNFNEQTYQNKYLVIINQSKTKIVTSSYKHILEVYVNNDGKTLGELRNISLQFVPPNAIWTTWDDDDWRHKDFLSMMYKILITKKVEFLLFSNRLEYNMNTKFAFKTRMKSGTMFFFSKHDPNIQYEHVNTSEDRKVKNYAYKNMKIFVFNNPFYMYLRLIHDDNTSVYVYKNKDSIHDTTTNQDYFEYNTTQEEKEYIDKIMYEYYKINVRRI